MVTKLQSEAVVFDIGNVLIEWQPGRFEDGVVAAKPSQAMVEAVDLYRTAERVDHGAPFTETICSTAEEYSDRRDENPGLPGEARLVTEDRAESTRGAEGRGWQTHLFKGSRGWAGKRGTTGLLTPAQTA
ncbi:hypothetical protein [Roseobacter weihaiensis]|uniref:hypothetical protein n=1 Tax=Roseobacter weihaiensis TaxID=2763262 RepID=UPI001D09FD60|nr:hypothetical protein [Roseobacter sp. H9]